jgi:hypothetical protein
MEKIKIKFTDFWPEFDPKDNIFYNNLLKICRPEISNSPQILFYSDFGRDHLRYACFKISYTGENKRPNYKHCDYAFSSDFDTDKNTRLPLYALYTDVRELLRPKDPGKIISQKNKFCCFLVSNDSCETRNNFFTKLSQYKKVDSGGKYFNNIGFRVKDKLDFIKDYKFVIAFENASWPGYTTEKIFEPMLVNSIPLYWGNPRVELDFNTRSFINYYDFNSFDAMIERIIEVDRNDQLYLKYLGEPWFRDNKLNEFVGEERLIGILKFVIEQSNRKNKLSSFLRAAKYRMLS